MSRRSVLRALTGCILLAAAAVLPSVALAADAETTLAERYAPVIRLVNQEEPCGHGEAYQPTDVSRVLGNPDVAFRGPWDKTNIIKVGPTATDLARGLFDYHLDFPGTALAPGCVYDEWSHRLNRGHAAHAYARVVTDSTYPGQLALQYWLFYVFNDFNDKHEGDWEMIQLNFDAGTAAEALRKKPALVGFSQHEGAESAHWGDSKLEIVDGTHPVVYPALGSHANYFTSALHLGRSAAQGVGCDDTSRPSFEFRPQVSLIPTDKAAYLRSYPWLGYEGHWGEEHEGFYNGPTGPNTKLQWTEPIVWSTSEWRDKSFTVPVGTSFGGTATDFFCAAVGTGSSVLTAIVGDPSPLLIAAAVVLGLILWLTSRTSWQPSAPLRLRRRRTWGAITNAARRLYFGHVRLFLAIGLLFLPLGALITGLQYVLFRLSGLNGLVDSAGSTNAVVAFLAFALGVVITVFGLAILNGVTAVAMVDIDAGRDAGAVDAYKRVLPKVGPILGVGLIVALIIALLGSTFIGVLLAVWLVVRWAFFAQVIVLEEVSPVGALHRSARLVRGDWWRVASMLLFVTTIALLLGPLIGTLLLFVTSASFDFVNLISSVVYAVVLPYAAIASTYLYFDLRIAKRQTGTDEVEDVLPAEEPPPTALAPG